MEITGEFADISLRVPVVFADRIKAILENDLALIDSESGSAEFAADRLYSVEEVFLEGIKPGNVLRGLRSREDLTQAQLAAI